MKLWFLAWVLAAGTPLVQAQPLRCEVAGQPVNPANGHTTQGLTGIMVCRHEDGRIQREQELRDGKFVGLERIVAFDGTLRERQVNARGNTDGRLTERDPAGQLRFEGQYADGRAIGVHRRYDEAGRLRRISFFEADRERAALAYTTDGSLNEVRCASQSVMSEDRQPCGFDGQPQTIELRNERVAIARETRLAGVLTARASLRADGSVQNELLVAEGKRISRDYGGGAGNPLRREREFEIDEGPLRPGGRLLREREWAGPGQLVRDARYESGQLSAEESWYENGQPRSRRAFETQSLGGRRISIVRSERYRDDGSLSARTVERDRMPVGPQRYYDERGQLRREDIFSEPAMDSRESSRLRSRRTWDETGRLLSDEAFHDDGSRKLR